MNSDMGINELLLLSKPDVAPIYLKMAQYVACQCTGCNDSPQILAFKAQKAMLEAHAKQENPIQCLNYFFRHQYYRRSFTIPSIVYYDKIY